MTKLKMGMHNAITKERFSLIKAALAEGMSEDAVMTKYEIKRTALKHIQKSTNFYEYRLYTEILPAARKLPTVIAPSSGLAFEDFSYRKRKTPRTKEETERRSWQEDMYYNRMVGTIAISIIAIIGIVAIGALVTFWSNK